MFVCGDVLVGKLTEGGHGRIGSTAARILPGDKALAAVGGEQPCRRKGHVAQAAESELSALAVPTIDVHPGARIAAADTEIKPGAIGMQPGGRDGRGGAGGEPIDVTRHRWKVPSYSLTSSLT